MDELLSELVRADSAMRDEGERESFRFTSPHSRNPLLRHKGFHRTGHDNGYLHAARQEIDDLKAAGLVRVRVQKTRMPAHGSQKAWTHEEWQIDVTNEGFERHRLHEQVAAAAAGGSGGGSVDADLEWVTSVLPVLQAVYTEVLAASPDIGASQDAVNSRLGRQRGDEATARVLHELEQAGYLRATMDVEQLVGPAYFVLTEKALQIVARWPGGGTDAAYKQLVALIEERIEQAEGDEERTRWERARDAIVGLGHDVLVNVLSAAAARGVDAAL
jgi:hypothetical protein